MSPKVNIVIDGAIGESTQMFTMPLTGVTELTIDMGKMTYINSIGVKHWILWTLRIPSDCKIRIINAPSVIASQASMVLGFLTKHMTIESILMPYYCDACGYEIFNTITLGKDYEYASESKPVRINLHALNCPKCSTPTLEPDYLAKKTFGFLG
jgi:Zn finger protein HypA/HybF involved in hydrogenase expression